jgi:hypothetical protein
MTRMTSMMLLAALVAPAAREDERSRYATRAAIPRAAVHVYGLLASPESPV